MKITVIGAGAWGTAVALLAAQKGLEVALWARRPEQAEALQAMRENREYLPGVALPANLRPTSSADEALEGTALAVVAVPSRALAQTLAPMPKAPAYLSLTKGLAYTAHGLTRMSQVIAEATGVERVAALSGPNLAEEIARFQPAASVVAAAEPGLAQQVQKLLGGPSFRVYTSRDLAGVELGGALKNVIALAAGMVDGLRLGDNAKAALMTRALREIVRFGVAQGAHSETFYGLSGLGDLIATCTSLHSRNRGAGEKIARGATLEELEASKQVVEGVYTVKALHAWGQESGVELPITEAVYRVVYRGERPLEVLSDLMGREAKPE
ncbi:Glycerol-3-phosphate dehydrogenase [NAD(P)+] [Calidithermus terrae]|uniref:Glycerol-3-phosphate dehydrogenase [NAD(P)+] n=1 Tax=Calidithermus terrae TaxID=1408545 RepID=A0A399ESW2_9DEIN|nr:NAD(P)H-dependent glycerol-3-phosphate dehydrogenase [Calidithermus terrae]RIH85692.1 Glycerol-3-phosphate dehydrogenase [NAD(P)+] [Calidithermus terrae]